MAEVARRKVELWSEGTRLAAEIFTPPGQAPEGGWPSILLCHGWGGLMSHLVPNALKFAARGYLCMTFDYRGWGESDGRIIATRDAPPLTEAGERELKVIVLREVVDPVDLTTDARNCLHFLWSEPGVDKDRIGIWGTSYGGGHAVFTAANDRRIKVCVAQIGGYGLPPSAMEQALKRAADKARGEIDPVVPQHGLDGVPNLRGTPDFARMAVHSQLEAAAKVQVPTLIIDAEFEELVDRYEHGWTAYMMIRQNTASEYHTYPCKHYGVYGDYYEPSTDLALEWFDKYL